MINNNLNARVAALENRMDELTVGLNQIAHGSRELAITGAQLATQTKHGLEHAANLIAELQEQITQIREQL